MEDRRQLSVSLRPVGRLGVFSSDLHPHAAAARWQSLGRVWHGGERMVFVRAEIGEESWVSLVRGEWLERYDVEQFVTLQRQTTESDEVLTARILFC